MTTLAQLQQSLQAVMGEKARQAGRESGFIERERKLTGETFVNSLVWGWLANPRATLGELSQSAGLCGVAISPQGIAQRMTAKAAVCLREVLEASMVLVAAGGQGSTTFLRRFAGVYLLDSTQVAVPDEWAALWPGGGNQHQRRGALKVQTLWDYQGGGLQFSLHPACQHDVSLPVATLPPGAVRVTDSGYFAADSLQALEQQGCFYLSRVPCKVHLHDEQGQSWRLSAFLRRHAKPDFDGWVTLTTKGLRCRLLAQRVPQAIAAQRRRACAAPLNARASPSARRPSP